MKRIVFAALAAVAVAGCGVAHEAAEAMPMTNTIDDWSGNLTPVNDSGIRGAAAVRTGYGQTGVSVTIAGAKSGEQHPWHVHRGTCGSGGPIVGPATAYPVLSVGANGEASASAKIDMQLGETESYYVNIHKSPSDLGTIVSCGEIHD